MNNFRKFEKIAIRWIVLSTFRTTGPCIFELKFRFINYEFDISNFVAFQAYLRRLKKSLSGR